MWLLLAIMESLTNHFLFLLQRYPDITTYFDAEIIGDRHSFVTRRWNATDEIDCEHWSRFPGFSGIASHFADESYKYDFRSNDIVYMRWKERFLVPDFKVTAIPGASFAGFYYISYSRSRQEIQGYYYFHHSERFQSLNLTLVPQISFAAFEFQ
jgi:glucose-induced degradation protein 4